MSDGIATLYDTHMKKRTRPSFKEYSLILQSEAQRFSDIFIVIDALDECSEAYDTRGILLTEIKKLQPTPHLLVTARPHISQVVSTFPDAVHLEIRASPEDIKKYIQWRLKAEPRLRTHIKNDTELEKAIIDTIVRNVKGMLVFPTPCINVTD
jgi:hypothetical protein